MLYTHADLFDNQFLSNLDHRVYRFADEMTIVELCKTFCSMGEVKKRELYLLNTLATNIANQDDVLSPKQLSNVLFAMNTLNFHHSHLFDKIAGDLIPQVASIDKPKLVSNFLFCIGQLRWKSDDLLEVFSDWVEKNVHICPNETLVSVIKTLATLSYLPSNADSLFNVIIPRLASSSFEKKTYWLEYVWSLSLLRRVTNDQVASVLNKSFISSITGTSEHLPNALQLKLQNINAVAHLNMDSYDGPYLQSDALKDLVITKNKKKLRLCNHIEAMFSNFVPPPKYLRLNIQTAMGVGVDFELATTEAGKPVPLQEECKDLENCQVLGPSSDTVKIAVLIWTYEDYTTGSITLTGLSNFAVQILEKKGYKVVQIPHYEYDLSAKTLKNVQYLDKKIKEAVLPQIL